MKFKSKHIAIVNLILFQAGWFACVVGASKGLYWLGPVFVIIAVIGQTLLLNISTFKVLAFLFIVGVMGFILDSTLISLQVYEPVRWLLPAPFATLWFVALWINFAFVPSLSLKWLKGRYFWQSFLGAVFGPLAYLGGENLGAIVFNKSLLYALTLLAIEWGVVIPLLFKLSDMLLIGVKDWSEAMA